MDICEASPRLLSHTPCSHSAIPVCLPRWPGSPANSELGRHAPRSSGGFFASTSHRSRDQRDSGPCRCQGLADRLPLHRPRETTGLAYEHRRQEKHAMTRTRNSSPLSRDTRSRPLQRSICCPQSTPALRFQRRSRDAHCSPSSACEIAAHYCEL